MVVPVIVRMHVDRHSAGQVIAEQRDELGMTPSTRTTAASPSATRLGSGCRTRLRRMLDFWNVAGKAGTETETDRMLILMRGIGAGRTTRGIAMNVWEEEALVGEALRRLDRGSTEGLPPLRNARNLEKTRGDRQGLGIETIR